MLCNPDLHVISQSLNSRIAWHFANNTWQVSAAAQDSFQIPMESCKLLLQSYCTDGKKRASMANKSSQMERCISRGALEGIVAQCWTMSSQYWPIKPGFLICYKLYADKNREMQHTWDFLAQCSLLSNVILTLKTGLLNAWGKWSNQVLFLLHSLVYRKWYFPINDKLY